MWIKPERFIGLFIFHPIVLGVDFGLFNRRDTDVAAIWKDNPGFDNLVWSNPPGIFGIPGNVIHRYLWVIEPGMVLSFYCPCI